MFSHHNARIISKLSEVQEREFEEEEGYDDGISDLSVGREPRFISNHEKIREMETKDNYKKFKNQDLVPTDNSFMKSSSN